MNYFVNENCIGCGLCSSICPQVFVMAEDGHAVASGNPVLEELRADAREAQESCPVGAIEFE